MHASLNTKYFLFTFYKPFRCHIIVQQAVALKFDINTLTTMSFLTELNMKSFSYKSLIIYIIKYKATIIWKHKLIKIVWGAHTCTLTTRLFFEHNEKNKNIILLLLSSPSIRLRMQAIDFYLRSTKNFLPPYFFHVHRPKLQMIFHFFPINETLKFTRQ